MKHVVPVENANSKFVKGSEKSPYISTEIHSTFRKTKCVARDPPASGTRCAEDSVCRNSKCEKGK